MENGKWKTENGKWKTKEFCCFAISLFVKREAWLDEELNNHPFSP